MKKYLIAATMLLSTQAFAAEPATFVCAFQNGESFTVVGNGNTTMIQWGTGGFQEAASSWEEPILYVAQKTNNGAFAMKWNVISGEADGWAKLNDGKTKGGPLFCAFK